LYRNVGDHQSTLRNIPEERRSCLGNLDVTIVKDCRKPENTALRIYFKRHNKSVKLVEICNSEAHEPT